jgi:hypothetical protein
MIYGIGLIHCKKSKASLPPKHGNDALAIESVWYLPVKTPHEF